MVKALAGHLQLPWTDAARAYASGDFVRAAEIYAGMGSKPEEAEARLRAAGSLIEQGCRAEANDQIRRAVAFWRSVGATRYVEEGDALLAASSRRGP